MARIKMTPMVRIALWALRVYLLVLLSLIALKFIRGFSERKQAAESAQAVPAATTNPPSSR